MLPVVVVPGERIARDDLRDLHDIGMFLVMDEFIVVGQLHKKLLAIIVRGKNLALVADQQARAVRHFAQQRLDVGKQFLRRLVAEVVTVGRAGVGLAAVIPGECDRVERQRVMPVEKCFVCSSQLSLAGGEFKTNL